ncbi:MAG: archaemetzincin family Zn-dependent metalloprotease [Paludibaculum sp.]
MTVRDNGEGISPENISKIFDPFFTSKPEGKGVGLGLAVIYGIVQAHDGEIDVKSTLGEGSHVYRHDPDGVRAETSGPCRGACRVSGLCLASLGEVEEPVMRAIAECVEERIGLPVVRRLQLSVPLDGYDRSRGQMSSVAMLKLLLDQAPSGSARILGVTECDLFIPMLTFVFGQAQLKGRAAVVSAARLRQEFYGMPADGTALLGRARKEAMHELGHTFGLIHCPDMRCAMSLSTNLPQVDTKLEWYCEGCWPVLQERLEEVRWD